MYAYTLDVLEVLTVYDGARRRGHPDVPATKTEEGVAGMRMYVREKVAHMCKTPCPTISRGRRVEGHVNTYVTNVLTLEGKQ